MLNLKGMRIYKNGAYMQCIQCGLVDRNIVCDVNITLHM